MVELNKKAMLEGGRASYAFESVKQQLSKLKEAEQKEFRSHIKKMPAMIQVNGLGQTLAFYYASKKQMGLVYSILDIWVKERLTYIKPERLPDQELVEWVISLPSPQYKVVTMEIMALLNWLRRFADGMIKSDR